MITSLSNPGGNRKGVARSKPAAVRSKLAVARNRPVEEHNRRAAHNTAEGGVQHRSRGGPCADPTVAECASRPGGQDR